MKQAEQLPPHGAADPYPPADEPTGLIQAANIALRNRALLVGLPLVLGLLAAVLAMMQPRTWEVRASFVPNGANDAGSGQLGSIAAQLGMNLVTSQPGQSPAFYGELLQTRDLLQEAVDTEYRVREGGRVVRGNLVQLYGLDAADAGGGGMSPREQAVEVLKNSLNTQVNPETGVVEVKVVADRPALAEAIARRLIALTEDFDQNKRRTQASARRVFAEARFNEARDALRAVEGRMEGFVSRNRMFSQSPLQMLEFNRVKQELELRQQVYAALAQSYEQARIDEVRNTPVITVLETPEGAARRVSRGTVLQAIFGAFMGFVLAVVIALVRDKARRAASTRSPELDEFERLRAQTARPLRWLIPRPRPTAGANGKPV
jgi:uncharacterized protein involved in exopolysaccharide biosynthesis